MKKVIIRETKVQYYAKKRKILKNPIDENVLVD